MTRDPNPPQVLTLDRIVSPLGDILSVTDADGRLRALDFADREARMRRLLDRRWPRAVIRPGAAPVAVRAGLAAYFAGDPAALHALPRLSGGTEFQRQVWAALDTVPPGQTRSYAQLAQAVGRPTAVRAVGLANGANPIGLACPCHRVIGSNGALTGYAGGVQRKAWLLDHERRFAARHAG